MTNPPSFFTFCVGKLQAGIRLDSLIAAEIEFCSRSFAATMIRKGCITVDGALKKPGYVVKRGETISGKLLPAEPQNLKPEAIPLQILYEDAELLVVNKAPGMVVHPAAGHRAGTLTNALMHHCPNLAGISGCLRPGIVHRLDKDTSGALVVAKNSRSMQHLAAQFKTRQVRKQYMALIYGLPQKPSGTIDLPIGRHPQDRKKMSTNTRTPRPAKTRWWIRETFLGACLIEIDIHTGRTHQIRVHCLSMGHPVIGDPVYGNRGSKNELKRDAPEVARAIQGIDRQMLHAWRLRIRHPASGIMLRVEAPMPPDMAALIERLRGISGT
jgi:23S rRNA pseudouridine1911/1915/1917 synthase